ncbi:MAG: hypothetical protein DRI93_01385 [Aquificota bacterium]|nr:MAG: hypothetical protein DRI93_01385 [Aquificota bacterium]
MREIELQLKVEENKDKLIEKVENFFKLREGDEKVPVEHSQFHNLLLLATSTTSVKEVTSFIEYQIGKDDPKKPKGWRKRNFGEQLKDVVDEVSGLGEGNKELSIRLVRLFLGYLMRKARYLETRKSKVGGSNNG